MVTSDTSSEAPVDRLGEMAGVAGNYKDYQGHWREVPLASRCAVLAALGLPAASDEMQAASLRLLERQAWAVLPPCRVVPEGRSVVLPVVRPAGSGDRLSWTLTTEDGGRSGGSAEFAQLPLIESRTMEGEALERRYLALPAPPPPGYHDFELRHSGGSVRLKLIVAPTECWLPDEIRAGRRLWGLSCQVYGLRSARNWGIGDFTDLRRLATAAGELGAAALGLNPLHALFPDDPEKCSPYSPSSRLFLNTLYIDVEAVPEFHESAAARMMVADPAIQDRLAELRSRELVDYTGVASMKRRAFGLLYDTFRERHLGDSRGEAFRRFCAREGEALTAHARFEALSEHFSRMAGGSPWWRNWPQPYQDPNSAEVAEFARQNGPRIEYYKYLQFLADEQLAAVQRACLEAGMPIGLYRDLAVGSDRGGAETWLEQTRFGRGVSAGAPPDEFNKLGQNWGLPPFNPRHLYEHGFAAFAELLRANMRHSGALRIDHALGLLRLYWIPDGAGADAGCYVDYPLQQLLSVLALESQRNTCLVVGEDLGTVPAGLFEALQEARVLSYRLLYFERDASDDFTPPGDWPALALAAVSTHDLPTLAGWWSGHDVDLRAELGLFPSPEVAASEHRRRLEDKARLVAALKAEGLGAEDPGGGDLEIDNPPPFRAAHAYVARSRSCLMMLQIEDVLGLVDQVNLPGTVDEHPNWRRKLPLEVELLVEDPVLAQFAQMLRRERLRQDDRRADPPL